jgi:hypothetical protein
MPRFWAAFTAALIAVNCPEPSRATVIAEAEPVEVEEEDTRDADTVDGARNELVAKLVALKGTPWAAVSPSRTASTRDLMVSEDWFEGKSDSEGEGSRGWWTFDHGDHHRNFYGDRFGFITLARYHFLGVTEHQEQTALERDRWFFATRPPAITFGQGELRAYNQI